MADLDKEFNKTQMLQFIGLFKEASDFLNADTPEYDDLDFIPIASNRFEHAEATMTLASDVAADAQQLTEEPQTATATN